jgi:Fur family ferric uptake transcriptional regulator
MVACETLDVTATQAVESMERSTRQRTAISSVIDAAGRPLSTQEVLDAAQIDVPTLGLATVYRNLKLLVDSGDIAAVTLPGDSPRYESTLHAHEHHHHFQCTTCKRVFDVHDCPGDLAGLAPKGFTVERHDLTLYGRCDECPSPRKVLRPAGAARPEPGERD